MKKFISALALTLSFTTAFAQSLPEVSTALTLSPTVTAIRLMETATLITLAPFAATLATMAQERGVAGKEQLKDELMALNDDMIAGVVKTIEEVRQPALKEFFAEIEANDAQMEEINSVVTEGPKLHRIAVAVTVALLVE